MISLKPFYFIRHGETDWNKKNMGLYHLGASSETIFAVPKFSFQKFSPWHDFCI